MMVGLASGTYSSIFIASPVLTHWKEREPAYRRRRERIEEQMGYVPAFPEENVIARVEGAPEEPVRAETPVPAGSASGEAGPVGPPERAGGPPGRSQVPGVVPEPPGPVPPPPAPPEPERRPEPPAPVGAPLEREPSGGDGSPGAAGDGQADGVGEEAEKEDRQELSEASAAALRRVREQGGGGRRQRRRKKHGRNR
jgi:SecD/SecF fusion protein